MINQKLTFAVQKSGRLREKSIEYLRSCSYKLPKSLDALLNSDDEADVNVLSVRDDDIPEYVYRRVADFGIVGENVLYEKGIDLDVVEELDFAWCYLNIAVPISANINVLQDLQGLRVATSYPNLLKEFLGKNRIFASVIYLSGSVEVAPALNLADAVCDLVQSGRTLRENGLRSLCELMSSRAVLVTNPSIK